MGVRRISKPQLEVESAQRLAIAEHRGLPLFEDGALTFREFIIHEPLPLAIIQDAVLEFLRDRDDAVVSGAQAVNAYVDAPRMTQDVNILSPRAGELAEELRDYLATRFRIAVRIREVGEGRGFRLFQLQKPRNRCLVDLRPAAELPPAQRVAGVLVVTPASTSDGANRNRGPTGGIWPYSC